MKEKINNKYYKFGVKVPELIADLNAYCQATGAEAKQAQDRIYIQLFNLIEHWTKTFINSGRKIEDELLRVNVADRVMENVLRKAAKYAGYGEECVMAALRSTTQRMSCSSFKGRHRVHRDENGNAVDTRMYQTVDLDAVDHVLNGDGGPFGLDRIMDRLERAELKAIIKKAVLSCKKNVRVFFILYYGEEKQNMQQIAKLLGYKSTQSVSNLNAKLLDVVGNALIESGYYTERQRNNASPVRSNNRCESKDIA